MSPSLNSLNSSNMKLSCFSVLQFHSPSHTCQALNNTKEEKESEFFIEGEKKRVQYLKGLTVKRGKMRDSKRGNPQPLDPFDFKRLSSHHISLSLSLSLSRNSNIAKMEYKLICLSLELHDEISRNTDSSSMNRHYSNDVLTQVLGTKEHNGCVRGVGGYVTPSTYFHSVKKTSNDEANILLENEEL
uniref:Uncharacterized protein n=1 Tax=Cucumis melo TaxID=3656 RepID=A0A9I9EGN7_CUCME